MCSGAVYSGESVKLLLYFLRDENTHLITVEIIIRRFGEEICEQFFGDNNNYEKGKVFSKRLLEFIKMRKSLDLWEFFGDCQKNFKIKYYFWLFKRLKFFLDLFFVISWIEF